MTTWAVLLIGAAVIAIRNRWVRRAAVAVAKAAVVVAAGLTLATRWVWARRAGKPSTAVTAARTWTVTLYATVGGRNHVIGRSPITGYWRSAAELQEDTMRRYVAAHGYPPAGTLCAQARERSSS
jgi:hypothetical protein